jgi:phage terminase large subunit-like protein
LVLDTGDRFVLEPFQSKILADFFAGVPQTIIVIPKGNGKTTLLAALALFHLMTTTDAEVIICAASRDQASILLDQARGLVIRSPVGEQVWAHQREIRRRDGRGRIRVLASDVDKIDGLIFTLGLIDELHRHTRSELYGIFRDGLDKRAGQMVTISTAGSSANSPLGQMRLAAHSMKTFRRTGVYNHARSEALAWHEYALEDTDDLRNLKLIKQANPASWLTPGRLKRRRDDPSMTPAQWARFACNVWTEGETPWIDPVTWDQRMAQLGNLSEGDRVYVAIRAAAGVGIGIVAPRTDERVAVRAELIPPPPGGRVGLRDAEFALRRICERYDVVEIGYDNDHFGRSADLLLEAGLPMVEVAQRPQRLAQGTATLWRLISAGLLQHDGDPELRAQVLAGQTKETTTGWYLVPTPQTAGLIALAMACHMATEVEAEPPAFVAL